MRLRQEMVIGGFTEGEGARLGFGALLLGVHDKQGNLHYCGKVGTGFNNELLLELRRTLDGLRQPTPAFINPPKGAEGRRARWVKPELVAEIAFTEWTKDGTARHPSFQGLRADKSPKEVVLEQPLGTVPDEQPAPAQSKRRPTRKKNGENGATNIAGISLTNPEKPLYPEKGLTKRDLALYYEAIGEWIVPHLKDRPLTLVRCPHGWEKECFYQKHVHERIPDAIAQIEIQDRDGAAIYMMANSVRAVVGLLQMGILELHPWGSRKNKLGFPDRIIFDFDPDEGVGWDKVVDAVRILKALLEELGLRGFLKTTGGKGLHVVVPIEPRFGWEDIKGFTKAIADLLVKTFPNRFTSKLAKSKRGGKIFVDYLRNAEGATAIATYSIRAKANAPVSTPISWDEIVDDVRFDHFNAINVPERLKYLKQDPWADFAKTRQSITQAMMKKVGYSGT